VNTRFNLQLIVVLLVPGHALADVGDCDFPEGLLQHAVHSENIAWQPCPENLPSGCQLAVLEGDPQTPGLFTVRFRLTAGFLMPPHTHPRDERVTLLSGRMAVAFGADATRADAAEFGPGDYYINARDAVHVVWADETSELQITGMGPWKAEFVARAAE